MQFSAAVSAADEFLLFKDVICLLGELRLRYDPVLGEMKII